MNLLMTKNKLKESLGRSDCPNPAQGIAGVRDNPGYPSKGFPKLPKFNIEGQVHFVTSRTYKNKKFFGNKEICQIFCQILDNFRNQGRFSLYGYVLMPDHIHLLIKPGRRVGRIVSIRPERSPGLGTTPATRGVITLNETNCPDGGRLDCLNPVSIKMPGTPATREAEYTISEIMHSIKRSSSRLINQKYPQIGFKWQAGFYDFNIFSEKKFREKLNYMHANPVRAGFVEDPSGWKYSSYKNYDQDDNKPLKVDRL